MPMAAASATRGRPTAVFSSSIELIHSPPDLMTSLERSVICIVPSGWMRGHVARVEPLLLVGRVAAQP